MKTFRINKDLEIVCEWKNTRNGFKHEATLLQNGYEIEKAKCCYLNRTWESFEFESVIKDLLHKTNILTKRQKTIFLNKISGKVRKQTKSMFNSVAMVAQIGDLLCEDQKNKNDWKKRMLKAGISGLDIPSDWDKLSENEKENRLNTVINELAK